MGGRNAPCCRSPRKFKPSPERRHHHNTIAHYKGQRQLTPCPPPNPYTGSAGSPSWQGPRQRRWSRPRRYVHSSLRLTGRSSAPRLLPLVRAYTHPRTADPNQQEALEKSEYAQAYALLPYPLLVCKGLAAQGMGGKTEVSLQSGGREERGK